MHTSVMDAQLKRTSVQQLVHMVRFLEGHKCLAGGKLRSKEQAALSARLWSRCANILNADGETRTPVEWKRYFNQYKSRILAKIRRIKDIQQGKFKGTESPLTELEERFAAVCGFETGATDGIPKLMLEINPLKHTHDNGSSIKNEPTSSYDSEQESSRDSDSGREEKPLIFQSEPKITLHEGVLTVNYPENPILSRHLSKDSEKEEPVIFKSEPKITLHEGVIDILENPILSRHSKRHKSDIESDNFDKDKDSAVHKCTNNRLEIFGQHVGMKLQDLQDNQRIIAEKIINDALFLAEMHSLTMAHAMNFANAHHNSDQIKK